MKAEILKVLKENKGYLSGQQLCESLGVSRTAVWKAMGQLKEEGYQIEAVRNRGYRLVETADVMTRRNFGPCSAPNGWEPDWNTLTRRTLPTSRPEGWLRMALLTAPWWWRTARQQARAGAAGAGYHLTAQASG